MGGDCSHADMPSHECCRKEMRADFIATAAKPSQSVHHFEPGAALMRYTVPIMFLGENRYRFGIDLKTPVAANSPPSPFSLRI
jgi:hypothetical protein